ncbi:MAG TPA: ABC transporter permease, partial [Acidimicrobiia bacterium]|nr:ABC transporter permease [Acidimicrobiia bacterium]
LVAVVCLSASLTGSVARAAALAGRADAQVAEITDSGFDERLFFAVRDTPGVAAAVPFVQTTVAVAGKTTLLMGFDERVRALGGPGASPVGRRLSADTDLNGVFVGPGVPRPARASHGQVTITTGGTVAATRVLGVVRGGPLGAINRGAVAFAALPVAQRLSGRSHQLDGIYVRARPGVGGAELERRLTTVLGGRAVVTSPRLRAQQATAAIAALQTGLLTVSVLALVVGAFVVFNTMTVAALERRRELATLRALGGRRRPLLAGFATEAAILGLLGAAVGSLAGLAVARVLVAHLPAQVVDAFDVRVGFILSPVALPLALGVGVGLATAAALIPGRRAVRVAPVEAMRPEGVLEAGPSAERIRWPAGIGGLAAAGTGLALAFGVGKPAVLPAIGLFWGGGLLAAFGFAAPLAAGAAWLIGRSSTAGRLGAAAVARSPRRVFVTAGAVAAALALVVAQTGTEANTRSSLRAVDAALSRVDLVVRTHRPTSLAADQLLPDTLAQRVADIPGVASAHPAQDAFATIGADRVELRGVSADSALPIWQLAPPAGRRAVAAGGGVIVTATLARYQHLRAGQALTLKTPSGAHVVTVAAVVDTFGSERGDLVLALEHLRSWYARPGLTRIEIALDPRANRAGARGAINAAVAAAAAGARVETGAQAAREAEAAGQQV